MFQAEISGFPRLFVICRGRGWPRSGVARHSSHLSQAETVPRLPPQAGVPARSCPACSPCRTIAAPGHPRGRLGYCKTQLLPREEGSLTLRTPAAVPGLFRSGTNCRLPESGKTTPDPVKTM